MRGMFGVHTRSRGGVGGRKGKGREIVGDESMNEKCIFVFFQFLGVGCCVLCSGVYSGVFFLC